MVQYYYDLRVWNAPYFQKSFCTFSAEGRDRCGKIPVEVDVGKISSGFSMNINEFSQLATITSLRKRLFTE